MNGQVDARFIQKAHAVKQRQRIGSLDRTATRMRPECTKRRAQCWGKRAQPSLLVNRHHHDV